MKETNKPSDFPPPSDGSKATVRQISLLAIGDLVPAPDNPRIHSRQQVRAIAKSIKAFGFNAPILLDKYRKIVSGHGRYEAAKLLGLTQVPALFLEHLTEIEAKAYRLAENQLATRSKWDDAMVAAQLKELSELVLDFDIEAIGFELPELDVRIQSLDDSDAADNADEFDAPIGPAVSVPGDLWHLGPHRLFCGNALESTSYPILMESEKAAVVITDMPYNVPIDGHATGNGRVKHREFVMAAGEMTEAEFTEFLTKVFAFICAHAAPGALIFSFMDWRHAWEMLSAGRAAGFPLLNLIVWSKTAAGMGSLYRSQHELVFLFRNGKEQHLNNIELGRHGRWRSNLWTYPGATGFARKGTKDALAIHPTVKPISLVSDAVLDCSKRNDVVLDPFIGSGTAILACERTGRRCFGIEIDPIRGSGHQSLGTADREKGPKQPGANFRAGQTRAGCQPMSLDGDDHETGYGKPPKHTRWRDGQSGNPKRQYLKQVESTVELIDKLLLKPIEITVGEKSRKVTTLEAILFRLWQKEVLGDPHALKIRLKYQEFARQHSKPRIETVFVDNEYTTAFAEIPLRENKGDE